MGSTFLNRIPKKFTKTVTFDSGTGSGATGTVAIGTVTGAIQIVSMSARCTTLLAGATATLAMGVAANTGGLIPQTLATDIDAGEFWQDTTPEAGVSPAIVNQNVVGNLILTVGTAAISAGVLEFIIYWLPLSDDGNLA